MRMLDTTDVPGDLAASDLHKAFGAQPVLGGLDLTVPAGTFAAVLGPSGSGKTTLLRILAGFERPDRGTVRIGAKVVDDSRQRYVPAERRRIGYVSQEGSLFPHLSVEANVAFGLPRRRRHGPEVGDLLDAVGLSGLARRYPHQLSGGQQQRVALARALAVKPDIVLLDEPFASLDAKLRAAVRTDVHAILRDAGATTVLVTHDQDEALSTAKLIAVIRDGTIAQFGSPEDIYALPADADLARFVGDANLVDGIAKGELVSTPFGSLAVRAAQHPLWQGAVTVLVRPEQLLLHRGAGGPGLSGRVQSCGFHGHDMVVRIARDDGSPPLVARVLGSLALDIGSPVTLEVRDRVRTWPKAVTGRPEHRGVGA